jgi:transposase-like protein
MGRKSVLTPEQWAEVERRHLVGGESINSLAKEFGINESSVRRKVLPNNAEAKISGKSLIQLANEKIQADRKAAVIAEKIAELPVVRQNTFNSLVVKMKNIGDHLMSAAEYGASTAHRLSALANAEVQKIDDTNPLNSSEAIKGVAAMTSLANQSSKIAIDLIAANKGGALSDDNADSLESLTDDQLDRLLG